MAEESQRPASIGKVSVEAHGKVITPVSATVERIEHDIAFMGRALIRITEAIASEEWEEVMRVRDHVQKLVDFYEALEV